MWLNIIFPTAVLLCLGFIWFTYHLGNTAHKYPSVYRRWNLTAMIEDIESLDRYTASLTPEKESMVNSNRIKQHDTEYLREMWWEWLEVGIDKGDHIQWHFYEISKELESRNIDIIAESKEKYYG